MMKITTAATTIIRMRLVIIIILEVSKQDNYNMMIQISTIIDVTTKIITEITNLEQTR